ncbi:MULTISPECIES: DinB family protein [unclassified Streptomyces]|uniref:DinB family protein n=1 Tax=unclassified Streptomyces TaxID=2593676 RepID=UPI002E35743C|nr:MULTISPECIES: DinB family protein [unclassified Streptomyces]WUC64515.1 DinB family protein [Streptomyces sp. NBC_00539]
MERIPPSPIASERESLRAYLDFHRATLAMKCEGLSDEELRRQASPPSTLSLLGLVRHMAEVERQWFRRIIGGADVPHVWSDRHDFQAAYDASSSTRAEAFAAWEAEVEHSRAVEAAADSLDVRRYVPRWEAEVSLRHLMLHMILEYARHNGHADLIREAVDGTVGV